MAEVIKWIKGRGYRYLNESKRVNGRVVTKSVYIGPLHPKRKKGPGVLAQLLKGGVHLGALAAVGKLRLHRVPHYTPPPEPRVWVPEPSVEAIQAKARAAATPDTKPVDLELLDMVREFEERLKGSAGEHKSDTQQGNDGS